MLLGFVCIHDFGRDVAGLTAGMQQQPFVAGCPVYIHMLLAQGTTKGSAGQAGAVVGQIAAVYVAALLQVELLAGLGCQALLGVAPVTSLHCRVCARAQATCLVCAVPPASTVPKAFCSFLQLYPCG